MFIPSARTDPAPVQQDEPWGLRRSLLRSPGPGAPHHYVLHRPHAPRGAAVQHGGQILQVPLRRAGTRRGEIKVDQNFKWTWRRQDRQIFFLLSLIFWNRFSWLKYQDFGMKTFFFLPFWDLQFDSGLCKYDNIAVSHVYVDIKGGVVKPHFGCITRILSIGAAVLPPGVNLQPGWRERDVSLFALGLMAMIGRRRCGTVWRFRSLRRWEARGK